MTEARDYLERRWWALALLCMTQFMVVLDASIVNIALPSIGEDVGISQENLSWVVNGYVLTFGGFLLLGGRMADLLGRRLIFMAGLVIVAGAPPFRGFPPHEGTPTAGRPRPRARRRGGCSSSQPRHFDLAGAVTVTAGLSLLVYAIVDAESAGWGSTQTIGLLALAVALLGVFTAIELRSHAPLVPFRIFSKRTLTGANAVGLMVGGSLFAMFFFITLYMQQVLDYSPIKAGLSYLPLALAIIISAGVASQLVTRIGFKPVLAVGLVLIAAGLVWFSQISVDGGFATDILGPSLLAAVGLGFAFVTTTIAAVSGIQDHEQGLASGLINTSQQIGGALGLAVLATIANSRTESVAQDAGAAGPVPPPDALVEGFQSAFLGAAGIAVIGLVLTLILIRGSDSRAHVALSEKES